MKYHVIQLVLYGLIMCHSDVMQDAEYHLTKEVTDIYPDFVKMAESFSVPAKRVLKPEELRPAIRYICLPSLQLKQIRLSTVCPLQLVSKRHHQAMLLTMSAAQATLLSIFGTIQLVAHS